MKKIFITGGGGYLGVVLAEKLLLKGYYVKIIDPFIFGSKSVEHLMKNENYNVTIGLTEDKYLLSKCMDDDIFAVIHLSGMSNDASCELNVDLTRKANVDATKNLLEISKISGVKRFLFASSCSVYGFIGTDVSADENHEFNPISAYAQSKIDCEEFILPEANNDFVVAALRKATLYGPSARMRFDLVINSMTGMAVSEGQIIVNGGSQWRPLLHVEDAADAYIYMLETEKDKINGKPFNIGSNKQNLRIIDLANKINEILPNTIVKHSPTVDDRSYKVNFDRINQIGWETKLSIKDGVLGVKKLIDNDRSIDFRDINHYNIKRMLSHLNL